jgi:cobalamin transport system substrate-binding protein
LFNSLQKYLKSIAVTVMVIGLFSAAEGFSHARPVTDQLGRRVDVPEDPRRIVSLAPSITEIIFALEQDHRLRGVTMFSDFPPQAKSLPRVGSYVHLDLERIVALKPDLCFATKDGNPRDVIERLDSLGIPVYAVDPRDYESVMDTLLEMGALLNAEKKAADIVKDMRRRIDRIKGLVAGTFKRPRVFFQIGIAPIVAVGSGTFIHELIVLAGGRNCSEGPVPYPKFSREQVLALAPEVFVITSMARGEAFERVKDEWSRWPDLPAVRNNRIMLVDSNLFDRPSPRLVDALELLTEIVHPELFEETR